MTMNREVRDRWVAALRSGEFAQTTGKLTRVVRTGVDAPTGHCCLGVLCELARRAGVPLVVSDDTALGVRSYDGVDDLLPEAVRDWALLDADPGVPLVDVAAVDAALATTLDDEHENEVDRVTLSSVNDRGVPFATVAALIERSL
jgi:hypothetical protein